MGESLERIMVKITNSKLNADLGVFLRGTRSFISDIGDRDCSLFTSRRRIGGMRNEGQDSSLSDIDIVNFVLDLTGTQPCRCFDGDLSRPMWDAFTIRNATARENSDIRVALSSWPVRTVPSSESLHETRASQEVVSPPRFVTELASETSCLKPLEWRSLIANGAHRDPNFAIFH
ncbi:hypothetical protein C8R44DRAFT_851239 [Mycena epipterygia]|nr:hypothetical protein C8R44DRAFT_851239 [Mycena epipterygia]